MPTNEIHLIRKPAILLNLNCPITERPFLLGGGGRIKSVYALQENKRITLKTTHLLVITISDPDWI